VNSTESSQEAKIAYQYTTGAAEVLLKHKLSLFVSTYQAQRVFIFSADSSGKLHAFNRIFKKPTGLFLDKDTLLVAERSAIWSFRPVFGIKTFEAEHTQYDFSFAPRLGYVTGDVATHELYAQSGDIYFVNTRFSCVSKVSQQYSFEPYWKPYFIDQLLPEDRCHLNGFCWSGNSLRYVTALAATNSKEGWRDVRTNSGIVLDAVGQTIVCRNLSMPHSPRLIDGKLIVLQSGKGMFGVVDPKSGSFESIHEFPGFLRGLSFAQGLAFIGLSKIRKDKIFQGLPISEQSSDLECSVVIFDIKRAEVVGKIEFTRGVEELFSVEICAFSAQPHLVGLQGDLIEQIISLPGSVVKKPARKKSSSVDRGVKKP
jgi:uncharacterized protein (TIGR03032 family)